MLTKCAVFVNLDANNGRAARRWESIAAEVSACLPPGSHIVSFRLPTNIEPTLKAMLEEGVQGFVSAGGDGSANFLLNLLMRHTGEDARHILLGGIGLGSSNDFIKPKLHFLQGLPIRLDQQNASLVDVGKAEFLASTGEWQTRYFIANASLGVTAEANWFFNHGNGLIRLIKDRWTDLAILYTAAFSGGIVLLRRLNVTQEMYEWLFGNIMGMRNSDLWMNYGISLTALVVLTALHRPLLMTMFDAEVAATLGVPVRLLHYLLMAVLIVVLISSLQAVGCILALGLLVTPAATIYLLTDSTDALFWWGAFLGGVVSCAAILIGWWCDVEQGPAIVLLLGTVFLLAFLFSPRYGLWRKKKAS